jgi:translation initiation factor 3 subunit H
MAAALAASLPAPSAAPTPTAPTYVAIPSSMVKLVDIEVEIPVTCVQLDGMVVTKIVNHGRNTTSGGAYGLLVGLDLDGTLEVSNCFPLPNRAFDDDEKAAKSTARYQASMLRSLKEIQADDSVVGFYQAISLGAFFSQSLLETQAIHQERLRQGGVVVVHDTSPSPSGKATFRAFRLSKAFLDLYKKSNFTATGLMSTSLTFSTILEELPVTIRTNPLLASFLETVTQSDSPLVPQGSAFSPNFNSLDLSAAGTNKNLERIIDSLDAYRNEENNLAYISRTIAREKSKADAAMQKRKDENATRVAQGLSPLPEDDVARMFKIPAEPSRLESMMLLGQIDAYAKGLEETSGIGLVKMYAAKACANV